MSKSEKKVEILDSSLKVEEKTAAVSVKSVNLLQEMKDFEKIETPFLDWNSVEPKSILIVEIKVIEERFAEGNVVLKNKQSYMRFALPSSLKTQIEKLDVIANDILAITYLGIKTSIHTANEYHSFIVKKKVNNRYLTTNQYLEGLNPF